MLGSSQLDEGHHALRGLRRQLQTWATQAVIQAGIFAQDHDLIRIRTEPAVGLGNVICHDQVRVLPIKFECRVLKQVIGFGGKAHLDEGVRDLSENVLIFNQGQRKGFSRALSLSDCGKSPDGSPLPPQP